MLADEATGTGQISQPVVLLDNANCTMELTKIDYNQPGNDTNDFIELHVTKKNPGLVTTLLDCGVGAIALYDDTSILCLPYSLTVLATLVIPADGYIEVGQNQSTVNVSVGSTAEGWLHNGRGEIAILQTSLASGLPLSWFQYGGAAKCNGLLTPTQVQTEDDASPNLVNVSCDGTFHLLAATSAQQKTTADCPPSGSGGAGGGGGTGGSQNSGGTGGLLNLGGTGLINLGGTGGLLNLGGTGLINLGGTGGLLNLGGTGLINLGGTGGLLNLGGSSGGAGTAGVNQAGAGGRLDGQAGSGTGGGEMGGGAGSGEADAGDANGNAGSSNTEGGTSASSAGSGAAAGKGATAGSGAVAGKGNPMVAEGGGCSCAIPKAQNHQPVQALALLASLLGLCVRRRKTRLN